LNRIAGRVAWMITPVLLAGLGQVVVLKTGILAGLATPLDGGMEWRGKPLLGPQKTWRGVVIMTALSALVSSAQSAASRRSARLRALSPFDYSRVNPWLLGAVLGLGYCLAELPNSFVKRRLGIAPAATAERWSWVQYLVDQSDSVAGCLVALRLFYRPSWYEAGLAFVSGLTLHIGVDQLMRAWGIKRRAYNPSIATPSRLATAGTGRLSRP
jgi:CDP-diglyceride synthetase